jgi:hypothetical protein
MAASVQTSMGATMVPTTCPVCNDTRREPSLRLRLLQRHTVGFSLCRTCGLLQTEAPYWLEEAYAAPIADTDTGIMQRNLENARFLDMLLRYAFEATGSFVDVAGGYGILTRLLRDRGYDVLRSDKYCPNLLAEGHEPHEGLRARALFAFEVLEHVHDPLAFVEGEFQRYGCRSLVFSTQTYGDQVPDADWWYYSPETGQHISFYQRRTLQTLAQRLGCAYFCVHSGLHLFTERPLHPALKRVLRSRRLRRLLEAWCWHRPLREPLTWADHEAAKQRLLNASHADASP